VALGAGQAIGHTSQFAARVPRSTGGFASDRLAFR
jgi:hypothetical protein